MKIDYIDNIKNLTTVEFKENVFDFSIEKEWKYKGELPCVIDFYADWCQPCKTINHSLEIVSKEFNDKILFYKVNIDNEPELASMFQIQSIPTLLFIPLKNKPEISLGLLEISKLREIIQTKLF